MALKSRICLYEGTWRKYHTEADLPGAELLLEAAAEAARSIMDAGVYSIHSTGNYENDYFELFQPKDAFTDEVILARSSDTQTFYYTPLFTSTSNGNYGATRGLVASYLMQDGKSFQESYPENRRDTMAYFNEFKNRDPRLSQTLVYPGYVRVGTDEASVSDFAQNATGYMIHKRVGPPIEDQGGGYRDVIMIRFAEVLLNYAEAKAELGNITQEDLELSINKIRDRVNLPHLSITAGVDGFLDNMYENTSDPMVLEVRRERRIELAFEGFRTDDLKRWKEGQLFRAQYEGIYIKGLNEYIDLNEDASPDLLVYRNDQTPPSNQILGVQYFRMADVNGLSGENSGRIIPFERPLPEFQDWEYVNPIPTEELTLNSPIGAKSWLGLKLNTTVMKNVKIIWIIFAYMTVTISCNSKHNGIAESKSSISKIFASGDDKVVMFDRKGSKEGAFLNSWEWTAAESQDLPEGFIKYFQTNDECKPVGEDEILITSSGGGGSVGGNRNQKHALLCPCPQCTFRGISS